MASTNENNFINDKSVKLFIENYKANAGAIIAQQPSAHSARPTNPKAGRQLAAPINFTYTLNDDKVIMRWDKTDGAKTYKIERAIDESFKQALTVVYNDKGNGFTDEDLLDGFTYFYRLSCVAPEVVGLYTYATITTLYKLNEVDLTVGTYAANAITLNWELVPTATSYQLVRSTSSNMSSPTTVYTGGLATYKNTGLTAATHYYYSIQPIATGYNVPVISYADATTTANLAAPGSFASSAVTATTATLTWAAVTNATGYVVERATDSGFTTGLTTVYTGALLTTELTGLSATTQYYFRIKATATDYTVVTYSTLNFTTTS